MSESGGTIIYEDCTITNGRLLDGTASSTGAEMAGIDAHGLTRGQPRPEGVVLECGADVRPLRSKSWTSPPSFTEYCY